ncbi:hypothetical protein OF83DRAFT_1166758 [Amylostereum chailletii]|nr:hypothetical protein OF83DRAFT_1166758 [Amylostereum chailletii]
MKKLFIRDKQKIGRGSPRNSDHARLPRRSRPTSAHQHHPWHVVSPDPQATPVDPLRPHPLTASRSSSLASIPNAPPQNILAPPAAPRTTSPYPATNHPSTRRDRPHPPAIQPETQQRRNPAAAIHILSALDPQFDAKSRDHAEIRSLKEDDLASFSAHNTTEGSIHARDDKKERKGFWDWASSGMEREKERREQRERVEEGQAELMRMIGYLTATASEDWAIVMEVCDRSSSSEANAKEAAKALRREFKYGEPAQQLSAARLWAIMLRNASETFVHQCMTRKFLENLEDVLTASRTSPVVRERLLDVLAAAAYASSPRDANNHGRNDGFRHLWRKVRPSGKPDEGYPFDNDDAMFNPPAPRRRSFVPPSSWPPQPAQSPSPNIPSKELGQQQQQTSPKPPSAKTKHTSSRTRVIPVEEDIRRLTQECRYAHGNATLLSEALAFARPEDLASPVIKEFYTKCKTSQELICTQIPWASAGADRSRQLREQAKANVQADATLRPNRQSIDAPIELTVEEQLLASLLDANEELISVLRVYEDVERIGVEAEAQERSKTDTRMDRSRMVFAQNEDFDFLDAPFVGGSSSSRSPSLSPSPSPSPPPIPSLLPAVHENPRHPLPPVPHPSAHALSGPYPLSPLLTPTQASQASQTSLAPPPHAPQGPRSPGLSLRSHSPSSENSSAPPSMHPYAPPPPASRLPPAQDGLLPNGLARLHVPLPTPGGAGRAGGDEDEDEDEEAVTPVKPSKKALGKRREVVADDPDDAFNPDEMFYERAGDGRTGMGAQHGGHGRGRGHGHGHGQGRGGRGGREESSEEEEGGEGGRYAPWHPAPWHPAPVRYAYDAVAERTAQLMREGQLHRAAAAAAAGGVH